LTVHSLIILTKTTAGAVTSFIPTLVATFNRSRVQTLLLVAPPYIFAAGISLLVSRMSDRLEERSYHIIVPMAFAMIGFAVGAMTMNLSARYLSLFLMLGGVYGSYNVALAWISSTVSHTLSCSKCLTLSVAASPYREAVVRHCNYQHDGQSGPDILAIFLPAGKRTPIS
jgi:hypothetical protein